jgi:hypothetical protein
MVAWRRSRIDITMHIRKTAAFMMPTNVAGAIELVNSWPCRVTF